MFTHKNIFFLFSFSTPMVIFCTTFSSFFNLQTMCTLQFATRVRGVELGAAKSHKKSSATGEMLELKKTLTRMRMELSEHKKILETKERELASANKSVGTLEEKEQALRQARDKLSAMEMLIEGKSQEETQWKRQLSQREKEKESVVSKLDDAQASVADWKTKHKTLIKEHAKTIKDLDQARDRVSRAERSLKKDKRESGVDQMNLQTDMIKMESKLEKMQSSLIKKESAIVSLNQETKCLTKKLADREREHQFEMKREISSTKQRCREIITKNTSHWKKELAEKLQESVDWRKRQEEGEERGGGGGGGGKRESLRASRASAMSRRALAEERVAARSAAATATDTDTPTAKKQSLSIIVDDDDDDDDDDDEGEISEVSFLNDEDMELDDSSRSSMGKRSSRHSTRQSSSMELELDISTHYLEEKEQKKLKAEEDREDNVDGEEEDEEEERGESENMPPPPPAPSSTTTPLGLPTPTRTTRLRVTTTTPKSAGGTGGRKGRLTSSIGRTSSRMTPIKHTPSKDRTKKADKGILKTKKDRSIKERLALFKQDRADRAGGGSKGAKGAKGAKRSSVLGARDENSTAAAKRTSDTEKGKRKVRFGGLQEVEEEESERDGTDASPSKSPIRTRGNGLTTRGSSQSRYRLQPSTPHNSGGRRTTSSKRRAESLAASAATSEGVKKRGGLLAKMKSLGGLKTGATRTGSTRSTTRSRSSTAIGAGASRPGSNSSGGGGGRWN